MRTITLLLIVSIAHSGMTQSFKPSNSYKTAGASQQMVSKFGVETQFNGAYMADLVLVKDPERVMLTFPIEYTETYDTTIVTEWVNPGLKGIKSVVCVQVEFSACCSDIHSNYYLVTNKDHFLKLPEINYGICDLPADIDEYSFPGDGISIQRVTKHYDLSLAPTTVQTKKVYHWTGRNIVEVKGREAEKIRS
ncbi:MAG: hypothetical protein H6582_12020 [Crocinitomicaceae bacterium]|nr:hypothetical protein [Crocinitomicaceae bacterium]